MDRIIIPNNSKINYFNISNVLEKNNDKNSRLLSCFVFTIFIFLFVDNILTDAILVRIRLITLFFWILALVINNINKINVKLNQILNILFAITFLIISFMSYDHASEGIYLIGLCNIISLWLFGNIKFNKKSSNFIFSISILFIFFSLFAKKQFYSNLIYLKLFFIDLKMNLNTWSQTLLGFYLFCIVLFDEYNINNHLKLVIEVIFSGIILYLIIISKSTNSLSGLITIFILMILPNKIIKNKKLNILITFILLFIPIFATKYIYNFLDFFKFLDVNALSKRDIIWTKIWQEFNLKILFFGTNIRNINPSGAHNFSLALLFNFGIIFFILYILLFIDIMRGLNFNKTKKILCIIPGIMLALGLFEEFLMNPFIWAFMYPLLGFIEKNKEEDYYVFKHNRANIQR